MQSMNATPNADRIQIGIFGKTNTGKSSLINALTGQKVSVVSEMEGTTTDPVFKSMEYDSLGPVLFMDSPGSCDTTQLSGERAGQTMRIMRRADIAVILTTDEKDLEREKELARWFEDRKVPVIFVQSRADESDQMLPGCIRVSVRTGEGLGELKEALIRLGNQIPKNTVLGNLVKEKDSVLLVMPQDASAPKGRLILPQVQVMRELLDRHCVITCVAPEELGQALSVMTHMPDLVITDSQVFDRVDDVIGGRCRLTSFSILMAAAKGDLAVFLEGAQAMIQLQSGARVLIAETCTHAPKEEDIGRVKLPNLIQKKLGITIKTTVAVGLDFPKDLSGYDLVLQCGGCMNNRRQILSRIEDAKVAGVPITNYGIAIAKLGGIIDRVSLPESRSEK
ncbi:MAG: [FeFe] hydrogenase H-cluster maturation GTPase HydF [Lachnospiraceae bacterium]|nr:[FeFe] hydrogenase H-cluster maturation GTPase HydF [Lachnospiraceae bacterium]